MWILVLRDDKPERGVNNIKQRWSKSLKVCFHNSPQVLGSVKNRIEAFAASHEDFPAMLRKAQQYLVARSKVDWSDSPAAVPTLRRSDSLGEYRNRKSYIYTYRRGFDDFGHKFSEKC